VAVVKYTFTHKQYTEYRERNIRNNKKKETCKVRAVPVFANYTLAFPLQLRKKHGQTSVRVVEKCSDIPVAAVQHTFTHNTQNNTMRQNTQNGTYMTMRILKVTKEHITWLYIIKWLAFITVVERVYSAVRTDSLYKAEHVSCLKIYKFCFKLGESVMGYVEHLCWHTYKCICKQC
jgi:hypothetical protein